MTFRPLGIVAGCFTRHHSDAASSSILGDLAVVITLASHGSLRRALASSLPIGPVRCRAP